MNAVRANPLTVAGLQWAVCRMLAAQGAGEAAPHYLRLSRDQARELLIDSPSLAPTFMGLPLVIADSESDWNRRAAGQVFWQFGWVG